ncbi:MAG: hypothetical protein EOM92_09725 [Gammaproteobacteria bacterium]|nr:hypothetical protein [Gammaproteobacteria bacterium]
MVFVFVGLILPNLVPTIAMITGVGVPVRTAAILGYFLAALLFRIAPVVIASCVFLGVLAYDVVNMIALMFSLSPLEILGALRYAAEVRFYAAPAYLVSGLSFIAVAAVTITLLIRRRPLLKQARLRMPLLLLAATVGLDLWLTHSPYYSFSAAYAHGKPFRSALLDSGLEPRLEQTRINFLMVMVEGLGRLVDNRQQELLMAPFRDPALMERYELRVGTTEYFGSTTSAEMRELCASRAPYTELTVEGALIDCLPARLVRRGFTTTAFNAFTGSMFDLESWYPRVGFQRMTFAEQLLPKMTRTCGAVFRGACDVDVANEVGRALSAGEGPHLVYWLTLNTHLPVPSNVAKPRYHCNSPAADYPDPQVCWMAEIWTDLFEQLAQIAQAPDLPPTAILIVGDHAPPLWSREGRKLFRPGEVTWASLWPRATALLGQGRPAATYDHEALLTMQHSPAGAAAPLYTYPYPPMALLPRLHVGHLLTADMVGIRAQR